MHNLHLILVKAENGEDACNEAESFMNDWGNENNWRSFCGAVSEDDEVYLSGEGRYAPNEESNTIKKINKKVDGWMKNFHYGQNGKDLLEQGKKIDELNSLQLWSVMKYAEQLYEIKQFKELKEYRKNKKKSFNIFEDEYYAHSFDEIGVTHSNFGDGKYWVVFVDVHS